MTNKYVLINSTPKNCKKIAKKLGWKIEKTKDLNGFVCFSPNHSKEKGIIEWFWIPTHKSWNYGERYYAEPQMIRMILDYFKLGIEIERPTETYNDKCYKYVLKNSTPKNWCNIFNRLGFEFHLDVSKTQVYIAKPGEQTIWTVVPLKKTSKNINSWNRYELQNLRLIFSHLGVDLEIYNVKETLE